MVVESSEGYCIDTSALIELYRGKYKKRVFKSLWEDINSLFDEGRIRAPIEVYDELKHGSDELASWAKGKKSLFMDTGEKELPLAKELVNHVKAWRHALGSNDFADPFVVAHAKIKGLTVITEESDQKNRQNLRAGKIPHVCQEYGVKCIRLIHLTEKEAWEY